VSYRRLRSISLALALGVVVVLLCVVGLRWAVAQEATATPFATRTLIALPTSTPVTPTMTMTPTPLLPPWLPSWPGVEWRSVPTSTEQPGCPDWALSDVDASQVDYRWAAECRDCLPGGGVIDPLATVEPWRRTPTLGPVNAWSLHSTLDVEVTRLSPGPSYVERVEVFPAVGRDVVGVVFSAYRTGGGSCDLRIMGGRAGSPVASDHWVTGGEYCFGPAEACARLAPGSVRPPGQFRAVPRGNQLVLSLRVGGYPGDCGENTWRLVNVKWIGIAGYDVPAATPTGTPASLESEYALTCPIRWLSEAEGAAEYVDTLEYSGDGSLGLTWPYADHQVVYGVLFRPVLSDPNDLAFALGNQGDCGLSLFANAVGAAALTEGLLYCAGSYEACLAAADGERFQWFELPDNGLSMVDAPGCFELALRIGPASAESWVWLDAQFIVDAPGPECGGVVFGTPTPTPTPEPSPTYVFSGRYRFDVVRDGQWVNGSWGSSWGGHPVQMSYWIPQGSGRGFQWNSGGFAPFFATRLNFCAHYSYSMTGSSWWRSTWDGALVGIVNWDATVNLTEVTNTAYSTCGYWTTGDYFKRAWQPLVLGCNSAGGCSLTVNDIWLEYDLWSAAPTPTRTPLPATFTPTAFATATVRPALSPTPALSGDVCGWVALRQRESVFAGTEPDWDIEINYDQQSCYKVVPGLSLTLPEILGGYHIGWPEVKVCVVWVRFPSITLFGVRIALDILLLPVLVWILGWIMRL
jgi:hypothetical protein